MKKEYNLSIIQSVIVFAIISIIFSAWVHWSFQGNYWGPFLPGAEFGIPAAEDEMGMYPTSKVGWDGQFYYYQSNDIFATKDAAEHMDIPAYRYQRIGMPLIARTVSTLFFQDITPPILYHYLQIFIVVLGFYFLIGWLKENNVSSVYAYGWLLSAGVINALAFGIPDPVGDAFFIMSIVFALRKKLPLYCIVTSFLLLVREGYAIYAAVIFGLTFLKKYKWNKPSYWWQVFFTMFPGAVVVGWSGYVSIRFNQFTLTSSSSYNITDYPFIAIWKTFVTAVNNGDLREVLFKLLGTMILVLGCYFVIQFRKMDNVYYAIMPYFFLLCCMGSTVWFDYSGYMKALGSVIIVIIIMLPYMKRNYAIRIFLIFIAGTGVLYNFQTKEKHMYMMYEPTAVQENTENPKQEKLTTFESKVLYPHDEIEWDISSGVLKTLHREIKSINIQVINEEKIPWYSGTYGMNAINASYHIYDSKGIELLHDGIRSPLKSNVEQGEMADIKLNILVPPKGEYVLRVSMVQEGVAWFYDVNSNAYKDIRLVVK